ncbi:MAG: CDP-glycerol glycerophosphotransferase family protein [Candidatus Cloacimonetes bacterium]|nr:CDP-glycerol glycerophosphotransferase family protein [Candidatus Cloacimonadota bacterium]
MDQDRLRFLFFLERDFHIALLKPLILYIHKNNLGEINVYAPFLKNVKILIKKNINFPVEIIANPWNWKPHITFIADFSYQYVEGLGKIVNIGHGTICKGWFFSENKISQRENSADLLCVPGVIHKKRLEKQVFKPIAVTGLPKLDNCFNNTLDKEKLLQKFNLNPNKKTVLLAPTFNEEFSILTYLKIHNLKEIFPEDINLIVKLHGVSDDEILIQFTMLRDGKTELDHALSPHIGRVKNRKTIKDEESLDKNDYPEDQHEIVEIKQKKHNLLNEYSSLQIKEEMKDKKGRDIYIAENYDTDEIYFVSDLLISDVSSVIYEFLSLNKPVLLFDSPRQKSYINYNESDLEWIYRDVGERFQNIEALPSLIQKTLSESPNTPNFEIAQHFVSIRDGSSTERVVKSALYLLSERFEPDLTVLYLNDLPINNPDDRKKSGNRRKSKRECKVIENRFGPQFPLISSYQDNCFLAIMEERDRIKTDFLLFLHPAFEFSPQIGNILLNHIKNNTNIGIVAPLILDDQVHLQQVKFRVKTTEDADFERIAFQLNYAFVGHNRLVDYVLPYCFLIRKSFLNINFTDPQNRKLSMYELLTHITKNKGKVLLAYDSIISIKKGLEGIFTENESMLIEKEEDTLHFEDKDGLDLLNEQLEAELKAMVVENPNDEESLLKLILYYYSHQKWEQIDVYSEMANDSMRILYYNIRSLEEQKLVREAYEKIRRLNIEGIKDEELRTRYLLLKATLVMKINLQESEEDILFDEIEEKAVEEDTETIVDILNEAMILEERNIDKTQPRGISYMTMNLCSSAIDDFDKVLAQNPKNIKALQGKGMALQFERRHSESTECFLKILEIDPENIKALKELMKNSWFTREFEQTEQAFEYYLALHPSNIDMLFIYAGICFESGRYYKSVEMLKKVSQLNPDYKGIYDLKYKLSYKLKEEKMAISPNLTEDIGEDFTLQGIQEEDHQLIEDQPAPKEFPPKEKPIKEEPIIPEIDKSKIVSMW